MNYTEILVRFVPPYTNADKYIACKYIREAEMMADWLKSVGADAVVINREFTDLVLSSSTELMSASDKL